MSISIPSTLMKLDTYSKEEFASLHPQEFSDVGEYYMNRTYLVIPVRYCPGEINAFIGVNFEGNIVFMWIHTRDGHKQVRYNDYTCEHMNTSNREILVLPFIQCLLDIGASALDLYTTMIAGNHSCFSSNSIICSNLLIRQMDMNAKAQVFISNIWNGMSNEDIPFLVLENGLDFSFTLYEGEPDCFQSVFSAVLAYADYFGEEFLLTCLGFGLNPESVGYYELKDKHVTLEEFAQDHGYEAVLKEILRLKLCKQ